MAEPRLPKDLPEPAWSDRTAGVALYHADSVDILPQIPDGRVDILWTDPPYGHNNNNGDLIARREAALGKGEYKPGEDDRPIANDGAEDMRKVVDFMLTEATRILKPDCCCCCCCGGGPKPTFAWLAERMDNKGLSFFHAVVWDKGGLGMGWRYRRNYEMVMVAHRRGGKLKWETTEKGMSTANVVRIPKIIPSAQEHPTPKPVELVRHFLKLHAKPGDVILDPFMGHGPVGVAAVQMGCAYIGIEIDNDPHKGNPGFFDVAKERIQKAIEDSTGGPLFNSNKPKQTNMLEGLIG